MSRSIQFAASFTLLALAFSFVNGYDPSPLQDICVAVENTQDACKLFIALHYDITNEEIVAFFHIFIAKI